MASAHSTAVSNTGCKIRSRRTERECALRCMHPGETHSTHKQHRDDRTQPNTTWATDHPCCRAIPAWGCGYSARARGRMAQLGGRRRCGIADDPWEWGGHPFRKKRRWLRKKTSYLHGRCLPRRHPGEALASSLRCCDELNVTDGSSNHPGAKSLAATGICLLPVWSCPNGSSSVLFARAIF